MDQTKPRHYFVNPIYKKLAAMSIYGVYTSCHFPNIEYSNKSTTSSSALLVFYFTSLLHDCGNRHTPFCMYLIMQY